MTKEFEDAQTISNLAQIANRVRSVGNGSCGRIRNFATLPSLVGHRIRKRIRCVTMLCPRPRWCSWLFQLRPCRRTCLCYWPRGYAERNGRSASGEDQGNVESAPFSFRYAIVIRLEALLKSHRPVRNTMSRRLRLRRTVHNLRSWLPVVSSRVCQMVCWAELSLG